MLIKNTNLRRIVSLLFVLCLLFCLVPTAAFADDTEYLPTVNGPNVINTGSIVTNNNFFSINNGTIETNAEVFSDNGSYTGGGYVANNNGQVYYNFGTVKYNYDTVNDGSVIYYNCGGTVEQGKAENDCFYAEIDSDLIENNSIPRGPLDDDPDDNSIPEHGVVYRQDSETGTYCKLWGVEDKPMTLTLDIKPGYEPYIKEGTGTIKSLGGNKYEISATLPGITVDVRPTSSVPATADMSNVPLWSAMLLVFAATAILTRKKKKG